MLPRNAIISLLLLAVCGCYHERDYSPTAPASTFLSIRTDPAAASIPADGVSRITIIASISTEADPASRTIDFDTTAGTFVGGTGSSATSRQVVASATGDAAIQLQSSQISDTAIVTVHADAAPAQIARVNVTFTPPKSESQLSFIAAPVSAPADGATVSTFVVNVPGAAALSPDARVVSFEATAGVFLPDASAKTTAALDAAGTARVFLRSPTQAAAGRVRASINNAISDGFIAFATALPESLLITSDKFALKPTFDDVATLTVQLRRQIGTPSAGQTVSFSARDTQGNAIGTFSATSAISDATGQTTTKYNAGGSTYKGPITIAATAVGTSVTGSTTIQLTQP